MNDIYFSQLERHTQLPAPKRRPRPSPRLTSRKAGNSLYMHRIVQAMTQDDLARKTGVSRRTTSTFENMTSVPSVYVALSIAEALDVPVDRIFHLHSKLLD